MGKRLPGVFANKIEKELHNNDCIFYSSNNNNKEKSIESEERNTELKSEYKMQPNLNLNINQKINNIFNSNRYVYKAEVEITTKEGKFIKKIIGQNNTHLITI